MAVYKVLQDIEAEDKLLGPLTLKQFIYLIIALAIGFVGYLLARVNIILIIPPLPFFAFFAFMAFPIGREQPNDVWLAARIRFLVKPRVRIWNQNGMVDLVTITVPKKVEIQRTDGLNPYEVRSRLKALASTLDSRGWAVKNVAVNMYTQPGYFNNQAGSDRLVNVSNIPQDVPSVEVSAADDILDAQNNSVAARFDNAIRHKQEQHMTDLRTYAANGAVPPPATQPTVIQPIAPVQQNPNVIPGYTTFGSQIITPGTTPTAGKSFAEDSTPTETEEEFLERRRAEIERERNSAYRLHETVVPISGEKVITPPSEQPAVVVQTQNTTPNPEVSTAPRDKLKELSESNYSVATIAGLAKHAEEKALQDDEVISLH